MKVENPRANPLTGVTSVSSDAARPAQKSSGTAGSDRVRFSGDLRLANAAVKAAGGGGDVRPDAVASARALLATGQLGTDLERLADRIVEALTYSHDDTSS